MNRRQVLARVAAAFDGPRPERFVNRDHCQECREHDDTLRSCTPTSISFAELGSPGWDPIGVASDEAFLYYVPALARLAFGVGEEVYLDQLVSHLLARPLRQLMSREQLLAVRDLLESLVTELPADEIVESTAEEIRGLVRDIARCTSAETGDEDSLDPDGP